MIEKMTEIASANSSPSFVQYWHKTYQKYMNDPQAKNNWRLRAICYDAWPLFFNRVMVFFERLFARQIMKTVAKELRDNHVLDIGCGTARWSLFFHRYGAKVLAGDLFPQLLHDNQVLYPELSFVAMSGAHLPVKDKVIDFLSAGLVFQYIPRSDKEKAILEMNRVLKAGGKAFILEAVNPSRSASSENKVVSPLSVDEWKELFAKHHLVVLAEKGLHAYPLAELYKQFNRMIGSIIKIIKGGKGQKSQSSSAVKSGSPKRGRHLFYHLLNQNILRCIALISIPIEFVWLGFNLPASHCMFLVQKNHAKK